MEILYVVGARPNLVKMAPVIAELGRRLPDTEHVLVDTGQHYDPMMAAVLMEELNLPRPGYSLGVGSGTHASQTARVMERIEPVIAAEKPDLIIVPGDVNSTLAVTLVAAKMGVPLAHLEAGLRSFDRTMPEEINRIVTDELSEYLLIHSQEAEANLRSAGIPSERIHFVGNTMIDSLVVTEPRFRALNMTRQFGLSQGAFLLVTLHRPALVDGPLLEPVLEHLTTLARDLPVVFPVHPRTRRRLLALNPPSGVHLLEPLSYLQFLSLEADAAAVLTDSGGVQEETTHLGVPCFTLRANTERPVTVRAGTNTVLGLDPAAILSIPAALASPPPRRPGPPAGWDGHAAERVAEVICRHEARSPAEISAAL